MKSGTSGGMLPAAKTTRRHGARDARGGTCNGSPVTPHSALRTAHSALPWLLGVLVTVAGCSSGAGQVGGGEVQQDQATQALSTVVVLRKWTQVLYPQVLVAAPTTPCQATPPTPFQRQPDGSFVQEITFENCVRQKLTFFPATGIRQVERRYPDGGVETITSSRLQVSGNISRQQIQQSYPDDGPLIYTVTTDSRGTLSLFDDFVTLDGRIEFLPSRALAPVRFRVQRANRVDEVTATLSDGAQFSATVPLASAAGSFQPNFGTATAGTYGSGSRRVVFELRGTGANHWTEYTFTAPDGVTGRIALNQDFSGSGQFLRNGQIETSVFFDRRGQASVTLVSGEATTAGPSAAALAFLTHAWRELTGLVGPAPGT